MKKALPYLSLVSSFGTLICCALPALLVTLGMGATLAAAVSAVPGLIWFSENKGTVFGTAGVLLVVSAAMQYAAKDMSCPIEPEARDACLRGRSFARITLLISVLMYLIGAFFAFGAELLS